MTLLAQNMCHTNYIHNVTKNIKQFDVHYLSGVNLNP